MLSLFATLLASVAAGQSVPGFELSLSNPGARSLGFGGAFVALADDATAAFANPAGLVQLVDPEISIEGRSWSYSTPYHYAGRLRGTPTGVGLDTEDGLLWRRSEIEQVGLSFLSFVYPKKKWALALYRHQTASFEFRSESRGLFGIGIPGPTGEERSYDWQSAIDLDVVAHGLCVARQLGDRLSLGVSLSHFDVRQRIWQDLYVWDADTTESFFAAPSFLPERRIFDSTRTLDDTDWGLVVGFLWRPGERWSLGGFVREAPHVEDRAVIRGGPRSPLLFPDLPPGTVVEFSAPLSFPDAYGLGTAYRSRDGRLTVSFEWDRVEYSDLSDAAVVVEGEFIADGDELHLGAEYAMIAMTPALAVRLGLWLDPDHHLRGEARYAFKQALLASGDDELHVAFGVGATFRRFQVDLGADFSKARDTVSVSTIWFF